MLGVCYYPEHWPEERWEIDARLMAEAGLELVRIGEFAWAKMEPQEGHYDWDWLDRAIEILAAAGLKVVLGTPTATPPAWLSQRYPDALRVGFDGRRWSHGGRRHTCPTSATYRRLSSRIVTAMAERYGRHPAIFAWQIDNELGNHHTARCACDSCRAAFAAWCRERYGTLDALNAAWGTIFWSQIYSDWSQIPLPCDPVGGGHNPSLQLDYRRFASDANVDFLRRQVAILRRASPGRLITTNIAPLDDEINWYDLAAEVDVISWDSYPHGFDGPADVAAFHTLVRGLKRRPFWVMEQQAGPINWTPYNPPVPPGQVRLWTYQAMLRGAENLLYFRWRAGRYGQEQYHSGLLDHAARKSRGYEEVQMTAAEFRKHGPLNPAPASVALLCSYDDAWASQIDPHNRDFDYWRMLRGIYASLWSRGIAVDILRRGSAISQYRLVIACAPMIIDQAEAQIWDEYVHGGGTLLLTCRSFLKEPSNLWSDQPIPTGLTGLLGARVAEWLSLPPDQPTRVRLLSDPEGKQINETEVPLWAEVLRPLGAEVIAEYSAGYYAGCPALTERRSGAGRALYLGAYPTPEILSWLWDRLLPGGERPTFPQDVEAIMTTRGLALLNHGDNEQRLELPGSWIDLFSRSLFIDHVTLPPHGVLLLSQRHRVRRVDSNQQKA